MLLSSVNLLLGILLLIWSADWFVGGAAALSRRLGMSPLVVGIVIVGFGTSAPELAVSFFSAMEGKPGLALGNALGSNIANLGLILGLTAWLNPVRVSSAVVKKEMLVLILATLITTGLFFDLQLSRLDGLLLMACFCLLMGKLLLPLKSNQPSRVPETGAALEPVIGQISLGRAIAMTITGLLVLLASSRLLISGAVDLATRAGISELVIGLTVVAIGTSLPELAAAIAAARRGENDMVLGNVLGSNMFNTLMVTAVAGVVRPCAIEPELMSRDMPVVIILTLALPVLALGWGLKRTFCIARHDGVLLVLAFAAYTLYLVLTTTAQAPAP